MKEHMPIAAVMEEGNENIVLFRPNVPKGAAEAVAEVLNSRWIGQGPRVAQFESEFENLFGGGVASAVSCGSGTDALHLAYLLAGVQEGDEVLCPVFTCTATNLPSLYIGAKPVFVDIDKLTMNISIDDLESKITTKTKAIVFVDYGGSPADLDRLLEISIKHQLPLIEDAAHALGATYKGRKIGSVADFTIFSFQAIKHITTGDGGMLMIKDLSKVPEAHRLRWFGIDRTAKFSGIWENDITEIGYKYQMNDISAAIGICSLKEFPATLSKRKKLLALYGELLMENREIQQVGFPFDDGHAAWLHTIYTSEALQLRDFLRERGIESGQVHFRNDRYSVFGGRIDNCPNMDEVEDKYLVLPLHTAMSELDVHRVASAINNFFLTKNS